MFRILSADESNSLRAMVKTTWDWDGGYWHPLVPVNRKDVLGFQAKSLEQSFPEAELRRLLRRLSGEELVLIREHDPDLLCELREIEFLYGRSEEFLAPRDLNWLIYFSHEETVAFAGATLLREVKTCLPQWSTLLWR